MAGIALYGDLVTFLASGEPIAPPYRLESVRILPPAAEPANNPDLYGAITSEAIARAEIQAPQRRRAQLQYERISPGVRWQANDLGETQAFWPFARTVVMIKLTAPDGSKISINGKLVLRIRPTVSGENPEASTRIDWSIMSLVREPVDQVMPLVKAELPSLAGLTALENRKFWFNAEQAVGPLPITPTQERSGFKSSIKIMGYRQYVVETPDEVRAVIGSAGGTPL